MKRIAIGTLKVLIILAWIGSMFFTAATASLVGLVISAILTFPAFYIGTKHIESVQKWRDEKLRAKYSQEQ